MERSKQTADVEGPTNVDMGSTIFACDLSKVWASTTPCTETTKIQMGTRRVLCGQILHGHGSEELNEHECAVVVLLEADYEQGYRAS